MNALTQFKKIPILPLLDGAGRDLEGVNAIDRGHQPYLVQPPSNPTNSKEAAAATAAFRVLKQIHMPSCTNP
jgi:hypothetical protein